MPRKEARHDLIGRRAHHLRGAVRRRPYATLHLADLGAEVIKIEQPNDEGDMGRTVPPYATEGDSLFFQGLNRNKKSITLDMTKPEGSEVFRRLVRNADAVFSNLRGDLPGRMGLTYADVKDINPRILCCHLTGYGRQGKRATEPAYDYLIQAEAGIMDLTGEPGGPPSRAGVSMVDWMGGISAAFAMVSGILSARASGKGSDVDVSLLDVGYAMLNYLATWHLNGDFVPQRLPDSAHPTIVPSQRFTTADGHIMVMCNKETFWPKLCDALGDQSLLADARFANFAGRLEHKEEVIARLAEHFSHKTTAEWMALFQGTIPAAPVNTAPHALAQAESIPGLVTEVETSTWGVLKQLSTPIRADGQQPHHQAPRLGEHTETVLKEYAALSDAEIKTLRSAGII